MRGLYQVRNTDRIAVRQWTATDGHDVQQQAAANDWPHLLDPATRRACRAARAGAGKAVVELIVVPRVTQCIDVRANMSGHQQRILGELKPAGTPRARRVVASGTTHEVLHARTMRRKRC